MALSPNKTKLVCTIGPASESPEVLEHLLHAGMNVARLNFSHGTFAWHKKTIEALRLAARTAGKRLAVMADLPGPKIRIGKFVTEPVELEIGDVFTLTTNDCLGTAQRVFVDFPNLPTVVKPGNRIFLNDGNIQLEVIKTTDNDVDCRILVGGELRSRKGVNLAGIDFGISAFTPHDHECLKFALENGVDAISQSFVGTAADIGTVRRAAAELGHHPFVIAKIERAGALANADEIIKAADGIMIARGDLGVETPIENIAVIQKELIIQANQLGKPVITATQMLESMVHQYRPTRAETTDVANAILDGTDCVMLSEESAMGKFPVEAVNVLARIAAATEPYRIKDRTVDVFANYERTKDLHFVDLISRNVAQTVMHIAPVAVIVPTFTGHTARMIARFKLPVWIAAVSREETTCQELNFSYGVSPVHAPNHDEDWDAFAKHWAEKEELTTGPIVLTEGPSRDNPDSNPHLEILSVSAADTPQDSTPNVDTE